MSTQNICFIMPHHFQWRGAWGHIVPLYQRCPYERPSRPPRPVRDIIGFRSISFGKINVFSYFFWIEILYTGI